MKSPSKGKLRTVQADVPESEILRACLAYLDECGILAWRNNSGRTKIGPRWVSFGLKGSGDILGILPDGRFLSVECKTASGRVSPDQESFMDKVRASGGVALVVHSAEELADGLGLKSDRILVEASTRAGRRRLLKNAEIQDARGFHTRGEKANLSD